MGWVFLRYFYELVNVGCTYGKKNEAEILLTQSLESVMKFKSNCMASYIYLVPTFFCFHSL